MSYGEVHFGRGGAGNVAVEKGVSIAPVTSAPVQVFTDPKTTYLSGRGGAGNVHSVSNMPTMSPDQYLQELRETPFLKKDGGANFAAPSLTNHRESARSVRNQIHDNV
ncbi:hypothetical protein CANCADRAFT_79367 [Tortispora caseinolytica NRRL Y-17796]|uniref:Uncharacterized protein n=1 Tax=Tortispora caseinolytica NRRL Y-17796 TaxID=767744 RepID=A0A1E4TJN5_9ASCO|nr:hypothetical protein CANCADRAFT_79367 [Tortispora caseinolytica NRRL Y-17796]